MSTISSSTTTTTAYTVSADTTGALVIQTGSTPTTALTIDTGQRSTFPTTIGIGNATPSTSGSGITFPATQSASTNANTLDDYEEGTWTPTPSGVTVNSGSPTYAGRYTKIGNMVYLDWKMTGGNVTFAAAGSSLSAMPFTVNASFQAWGAYGNAASNTVGGFFMAEATTTTMYCSTTITAGNISGSMAYSTS